MEAAHWMQRVLVAHDAHDAHAVRIAGNACAALDWARIPHEAARHDAPLPDPLRHSAVLLCAPDLSALGPVAADALTAFVRGGGALGVLMQARPGPLAEVLGIVAAGGPGAAAPAAGGGLRIVGAALPAFAGLELAPEDVIVSGALDQIPAAGARVLATNWGGRPVAWTHAAGEGRTAYWNGAVLGERRARGLIVQTLEAIQPLSVAAAADAAAVQIDDFPLPPVHRLPAQVRAGQPRLAPQDFYAAAWWPDMRALAARHAIPLSCFCAFDYSERPEEVLSEGELAAAFAPLKAHPPAEIGLHGLNHRPLRADLWGDPAAMAQALARARAFWTQLGLGPPPVSYVPPMNVYDAPGLAALHAAFPELTTLCGSFFGEVAAGGAREFAPEPWRPGLFGLPRVTSGHENLSSTRFDRASQVAALGAWTHFVHPDDALDVPPPGGAARHRRNPGGRPWRARWGGGDLRGQFAALLADAQDRFGWLTYRTTADAAERVAAHLASRWSARRTGSGLRIDGPAGGTVRVRLNRRPWGRIAARSGCEPVHEAAAGRHVTYVLRLTAPTARLTLAEGARWRRRA